MDKHFCPYCMNPITADGTCPTCGLNAEKYVPSPHHLPPGTVLLDRYLVGRVLGEGGFGITYIGFDLRLELKVAIKEYYPIELAARNAAVSTNVTSFIGSTSKSFARGKQKFLNEARTMARMDKQQVIVGVRDFFEANNTVYIVMEYVEGTTLAALAEQRGGRIAPDELFRVIEPLFAALSALHEAGLIHRDISPDNLMLENGEVRLLDFGCAREPTDRSNTLTVSFKHSYAPLEQYQESGQGPWTDIYALCATIYHCLTGQSPPRALDRIGQDKLLRPSELGVPITPQQEQALLKGLRLQPNRRFQTAKELRAALYVPSGKSAAAPVRAAEPASSAVAAATSALKEEPRRAAQGTGLPVEESRWKRYLPYGLGMAILLALVLSLTRPGSQMAPVPTAEPVSAVPASEPVTATVWDEARFWALIAGGAISELTMEIPDSRQPSLIVAAEEALFANAAVVTSFEEMMAANSENIPIVLGADITQTQADPDPAIHVPLLIPEGYTLTSAYNEKLVPFSLCDSFVINRGSMQGHFYMEDRGVIVNYGLFGAEATASASGSRLFMRGHATLLNLGTAVLDDWTLFSDGTALYNRGQLIACRSYFEGSSYLENRGELRVRGISYYVPGLHLSGGALLENHGTLTVETTGKEVSFMTGGEARGVGRSEGTLVNFAQIVNRGKLLVEADTHLYNLWMENDGTVTVSPQANFDPRGSVMWGAGSFALGPSGQKAYLYCASGTWTGNRREVNTAEALRDALGDPAVDCVFLIGEAVLNEALTVTKPLRVDGGLTFNGDAALTLDGTTLELGGNGAKITATHILMKNGAVFRHEGGGSQLAIRDGGTLSLDDALYLGAGSPALGRGAALTLQGSAAMALSADGTPMSSGSLTLEDSAVYSFVNRNESLRLRSMEIVLCDSASLLLGGGAAQLDGCTLTLEGGAQARLASGSALLHGCRFTVEKGASFYVGNLPVHLSASSRIENRGYMDIRMTGADKLQIDGGASIVNSGELHMTFGLDDPQEFIRSGAIVNHGTLHTDT